jgi:hypothetical protein
MSVIDEVYKDQSAPSSGSVIDQVFGQQQKGGGITNETETSQDSDAGRNSQQQIQPQDSGGGLQTSQQRVQGKRKEPMRSLNSSDGEGQQASNQVKTNVIDQVFGQKQEGGGITNEEVKQTNVQAKDGGKGQKDGQGIRSQGNAGNEAEITTEQGGVLPPTRTLSESAKDFAFGALSRYEAGLNRGMAGISRTLESVGIPHGLTERFSKAAEDAETDWRILAGAEPLKEGSAASTAAEIVASAAKLPAYALGGPIGIVGGVLDAYGNSKENFRERLLKKGLSEKDANAQSTTRATISTLAALPLYFVAGSGSAQLAEKFVIPNLENELIQKAATGGINFALNSVASATARAVDAGLSGEDPIKAAKELSVSGALQDAFFAIHSTVENFSQRAKVGEAKEAIKDLPDATLAIIANHPKSSFKDIANEEIQKRQEQKNTDELSKGAADAGAPITAEVIKQGDVLKPEPLPPEIQKRIAVSEKEAKVRDEALSAKWEEMMSHPEGSDQRNKAFEEYIDISSGKVKQTETKAEVKPTETEATAEVITKPEDATETGEIKKDTGGEYPQGDQGGETAETSYSHSLQPTKEGQKEVKGNRIYAAAYRDPETGVVHEAKDHQSAEALAGKTPTEEPAERETPQHGFTTDKGEFISREDAEVLAKKSGQYIGKFTDRPVLHSQEVELDKFPSTKNTSIDVKDLHQKSAREGLQTIFKDNNIDPVTRKIADAMSKVPSEMLDSDKIVPKSEAGGRGSRAFRYYSGKIGIGRKGTISAKTIIHEAGHTLTADQIKKWVKTGVKSGKAYAKALEEALANKDTPDPIKRLINLYKSALEQRGETDKYLGSGSEVEQFGFKTKFGPAAATDPDITTRKGGLYGFANLDEFVSETWSNQKFRDELKQLKGDGKQSMWETFVNIISRLLNLDKDSLAASVIDTSIDISRMGGKELEGEKYTIAEKAPKEQAQKQGRNFLNSPSEATKTDVDAMTEASIKQEREQAEVKNILDKKPFTFSEKVRNDFNKLMRKSDLTQDDMSAMGIGTPSDKPNPNLKQGAVAKFVQQASDVVDNATIPNLSRAGVKEVATQAALVKRWTQDQINLYKAEIFGDAVDNKEVTSKVMDALSKDNIVGGHAEANEELGTARTDLDSLMEERNGLVELKASTKNPKAAKSVEGRINKLDKVIGSAKAKVTNLAYFIKSIEDVHNIDAYERELEALKGTETEGYIKKFGEVVNPVMDEYFAKLKNDPDVEPIGRGKVFGVRINLLGKDQASKMEDYLDPDKKNPVAFVTNYRNPDVKYDKLGKRATFTAQYSDDLDLILANSFSRRFQEGSKLDLYNDLIDKGAAVMTDSPSDVSEVGGKESAGLEIKFPVTDPETGVTTRQTKFLHVQRDLVSEIKQILDVNDRPEMNPIAGAITKIQVLGIVDATAHGKNQISLVQSALGDKSVWHDVLFNKIPIVGQVRAINEIYNVTKEIHSGDVKVLREIAELSKLTGLRQTYPKTGIFKKLDLGGVLHDTDTAVRLILNRRYDQNIKRYQGVDTPEARINFINQVGEYNRRLMSRWQASLKDSGMSPFIVAGRAFNRMARKLVLGDPSFKSETWEGMLAARSAQVGGLVFATLVPSMINLYTTGSMFGRQGTPIGAIDFGPDFDTKDGKRRTFDVFQITGIRRGLRQLGINAVGQGLIEGKDPADLQRDLANDVLTTSLHPVVGPALGFLTELFTGKRIDMRTGYATTYDSRNVGGLMQYLENFRVGLKQQNQLLYDTGAGYALEKGMEFGGIPRPQEESSYDTLRDFGYPDHPNIAQQVGKVAYAQLSNAVGAFGGKLAVSPALKLSAQLGQKEQYTPQQDLRYTARQHILQLVKDGKIEEAKDAFVQGVKDGILVKADQTTLKGKIKQPDLLVQRVTKLKTADEAIKVFRVASPEEQATIEQKVFNKIKNSTALTPQERTALYEKFYRLAKKGTATYNYVNS